jgi:hypothetical protein
MIIRNLGGRGPSAGLRDAVAEATKTIPHYGRKLFVEGKGHNILCPYRNTGKQKHGF